MERSKVIVGGVILVVCFFLWSPAQGRTVVSDLISDFRVLTDEIAAQGSIVHDSEIVVFLNRAQDKVVRLGGFLPKKHDIVHSSDSLDYQLPSDVKRVTSIETRATAEAGNWIGFVRNEGFVIDTTVYQFYVRWDSVTAPRVYVSGDLETGDTIRVSYLGDAVDLTATTDSCEVPTNLQTFIIEEAIASYYRSKQNFSAQQQTQDQTRLDIGLVKQVEQ